MLCGEQTPSTGCLCLVVDTDAGELWVGARELRASDNGSLQSIRLELPAFVAPSPSSGEKTAGVDDFTPIRPAPPPVLDEADLDLDLGDSPSQRFIMRTIDAPLDAGLPQQFRATGSALVVGGGSLAQSLALRLEGQGVRVHRVQRDHRVEGSALVDQAAEQLQQFWKEGAITHVFLAESREQGPVKLADLSDWQAVYQSEVLFPYFLTQRWLQLASDARLLDKCTLVAAVDLGGDFGFKTPVESPQCGALTGLVKALCLEFHVMREHKGFLAKAIDAPRDEPVDRLADNILRELAAGTVDYEVAYMHGKRRLQVALPRPVRLNPRPPLRRGSTWVVTGGARGITAECVRELGRRFGLRFHLIGTSRRPEIDPAWRTYNEDQLAQLRGQVMVQAVAEGQKPNEAWDRVAKEIEIDRTLSQFQSEGIQCTYHTCDVADPQGLAEVLQRIRKADGPIQGVLHGAGIERSCRFEKKAQDQVLATLGAKVAGAFNLMKLTETDPIDHFLAFGSISGRLGSNGQTDYCAASDMLCKMMSWYQQQHKNCHSVAFHWHPWDEAGMAYRPENRATLERTRGPQLMPKRIGIKHLIRELHGGPGETEVLITDWEYHQRYYPSNVHELAAKLDQDLEAQAAVETATAELEPPLSGAIAQRLRMRMVDSPLGESLAGSLGDLLILGDNADAQALLRYAQSKGVGARILAADDDADRVVAQLEEMWSEGPILNLVLMTARDSLCGPLTDRQVLAQRMSRGVYLPFRVAQRWVQLLSSIDLKRPATIVAATSLGGAFGFEGAVPSPEGGALAGLIKSIYVEDAKFDHGRFRAKVIDSPPGEDSARLAEAMWREMHADRPDVEVAWSGGRRRTVQTVHEPVESLRRRPLRQGGVWVVTGGARGITAASALELAKRYQLKLHLIGKSPAPRPDAAWRNCSEDELKAIKRSVVMKAVADGRSPEDDWDRVRKDREIWDSLQAFASAGVAATYHSCDVADWDALADVLREIRRHDGPIQGILHGAGYAKSARLETRFGDRLVRTVAPKVDGSLALMALTADDPLEYFVAFGSLSGRFGGNGLSDYAAANDMMAKLCDWFRSWRPECHTACFHWQTWDQIGMAILADGVGITKNAFKMDFLSPQEGIDHLHQELCAGLPAGEVLITDGFFQQAFYPDAPTAPNDASERPSTALTRPLVAAIEQIDGQTWKARVDFDPVKDPFLREHTLKAKPFLPGVVGIESIVEAASMAHQGTGVFQVDNVEIVNGLAFHQEAPVTTQVKVVRQGEVCHCVLTSEQRDRKGRLIDAARVHVRGDVCLLEHPGAIMAEPPGRPPLGWFPHQYPDDGMLYHGPPLRSLKEVAYQYDGGWGKIVAPPLAELAGDRPAERWLLPLSVLDACVVACGSFLYMQFGGVLEVPHGVERLRWTRLPETGECCVVRLYFKQRDDRHSRFDFTLYGRQDEPLLQAIGYRTIRVGGGA